MTKKTKKIISLILMSCLFSQISTEPLKVFADSLGGQVNDVIEGIAENEADSQGPIINSVETNKESLVIGDTLEVYMDVIDEGSGVADVYLDYKVGNEEITQIAVYNEEIKKYSVSINITEEMGLRNISLQGVSATDKNSNHSWKNLNLGTYYISNLDGQTDYASPYLISLEYKDKYYTGEKFEVVAEVSDDLSGVGKIEFSYTINDIGKHVELEYDESTNTYRISEDITEDLAYSNIQIHSIYLYDNAGNYSGMGINKFIPILDPNSEEDVTAPKLNSIEFNKEKVKIGEKLEVYIDATDDISGVSLVKGIIEFDGHYYYRENFIYNEEIGKYVASVIVDEDYLYNEIKVTNLYIYDKSGNETYLEDAGITGYVVDENGNFNEKPIINSVSVNKNNLVPGEILEVYVDATDKDSGIEKVIGYAPMMMVESKNIEFVYDEDKKLYVGKMEIPNEYKNHFIEGISVAVYDKAGKYENYYYNQRIYINDPDNIVDNDRPIINSIDFKKENLKIGDTFSVVVNAVDEISGIQNVSMGISIGNKYSRYELQYDENIKKYVLNIDITEDMKYKKIEISRLEVSDKSNNYVYRMINTIIYVLDENGVSDEKNPVIKNITYNKIIKAGETLEIILDAEDDISGIEEAYIVAEVNNNSSIDYKNYHFKYDESIKKYKVSIPTSKNDKYMKLNLVQVSISDKAGNSIYEGLEKVYISDENGVVDKERPVINSINFNKDIVRPGETLEITLDAKDELSGLPKTISISYYIGKVQEYMQLRYDESTRTYKGKLPILDYMLGKNIYFFDAYLNDNAGNAMFFNMDKVIPVSNGEEIKEIEKPIINSVTYNEKEYKVGETISIYVDTISEKSPIEEIILTYYYGTEVRKRLGFYNDDEERYVFNIYIEKDMVGKEIILDSVSALNEDWGFTRLYLEKSIKVIDNSEKIDLKDDTPIEDVVNIIKNTEEKNIEIKVDKEEKVIDKSIFEAIAGTDKNITFTQNDGTVWTFNGQDINKENINNINISVSNIPSEEAKKAIDEIDKNPIFIKFDYHGILPGKALVKLKVDKDNKLTGKNLTLYYYNEDSKEIEKISDNIKIDENGFVLIEINHCSDYFLSENSDLATIENEENVDKDEKPTVDDNNKDETPIVDDNNKDENPTVDDNNTIAGEKETETSDENNGDESKTGNKDNSNSLPETGAKVESSVYILFALTIISIGFIFLKKNKSKVRSN